MADVSDPQLLAERLNEARLRIEANLTRLTQARARLDASRQEWLQGRTLREAMHDSAYARLLARFESQGVIEQAKGILMAESHCSADQAFDFLRRASQRENVPLREIAARIVARPRHS